MATAVSVMSEEWFEVDGSEFLLKPLTPIDMMKIIDKLSFNKNGDMVISAEARELIIETGLLNWRNFNDENGKAVPFLSAAQKNIQRLPWDVIEALSIELLSRGQIGEDDEKK